MLLLQAWKREYEKRQLVVELVQLIPGFSKGTSCRREGIDEL